MHPEKIIPLTRNQRLGWRQGRKHHSGCWLEGEQQQYRSQDTLGTAQSRKHDWSWLGILRANIKKAKFQCGAASRVLFWDEASP